MKSLARGTGFRNTFCITFLNKLSATTFKEILNGYIKDGKKTIYFMIGLMCSSKNHGQL